jgi:ketosteroid isomerase-like protein
VPLEIRVQQGNDMQSASPESAVLKIFERLRQAMLRNDADTLRSHIAEDYRGSDAGGRLHGRDEYLAAYGPGGVALTTFEVSDLHTVAWADTVLVSGEVELRGAYQGQQFEHRSRFLDVYRQQDGAWRLVASSVTDIV